MLCNIFQQITYRNINETITPGKKQEKQIILNLSEGEAATTLAMHDYCTAEKKAGRNAAVFYLHNKGGCCVRQTEPSKEGFKRAVASWREVCIAIQPFSLQPILRHICLHPTPSLHIPSLYHHTHYTT